MKSTKSSRTTKPSRKRAVKDLPARKGQDAKGGNIFAAVAAGALSVLTPTPKPNERSRPG
jgi:hypothetical protein